MEAMNERLSEEAFERALDLLARASTDHGFVASPAFEHYAEIWARDAAISSLGALVSGRPELVDAAIRSMQTMGRATTPLGQVAAVIRPDSGSWDWGEGGVVDATAWYVILAGAILETTGDEDLVGEQWSGIAKAIRWLRHQDVTGSGLVSAAPSTDWMDASLVRSGRTLNLNVLYHWACSAAEDIANALGEPAPVEAGDVAWRINTLFWPSEEAGPEQLLAGSGINALPDRFAHPATVAAHRAATRPDRAHYVSHVIHSAYDEHCDVLANLIAVCTGVADTARAGSILDYMATTQVHEPYPTRVWVEPIDATQPSSMYIPGVETHLDPGWHNPAFGYHNGAVWPYVGGFHVTALALRGRNDEARILAESLAAANEEGDWGFQEWMHGRTGEPHGARDQTWNAGMYVLASEALKRPQYVRALFG